MIDLHTHTTASDGSFTPLELVTEAKAKGITILGITDHDTINGVKEAIDIGKKLGVKVIPGVELGTDFHTMDTHILGYFNESNYMNIEHYFDWILQKRDDRNIQLIKNLNDHGYEITFDEVMTMADGGTPGRPHIAKVLIKKGYAKTVSEAFDKILLKKGIYIKREKTTPESAIKEIIKAGGIPVLAHPVYLEKEGLFEEALTVFLSYGLQGIEVFHSDHEKKHEIKYARVAKENNLLITGGSDFHGANKENVTLGCVAVDENLTVDFLKALDR